METGNRLTAARGKWGGRKPWKEGKGASQRTCMNDPRTWTIVWGWIVGVGVGWVEKGKGEKLGQL